MSSYNAFRDNYPPGFNGIEGKEEETYIFYLNGEVEVEHYTEEEALEELLDMTVREALMKGLSLD